MAWSNVPAETVAGLAGPDAFADAQGDAAMTKVGRGATLVVMPEDAEDIARAMANDVVAAVLQKSEYEALKVLAWRFPHGTHVTAMSTTADYKAEHHAIYISSEEVIHKRWPDGVVQCESWISFLLKYPRWRIFAWPTDSSHGDEIAQRARRRVGDVDGYSDILSNSEHFAEECYTGIARSGKVSAGATTIASCTTASCATGAAIAVPFAYSTTTVYAFGIIPVGTATIFSGGVVAAGAMIGAAVGTAVVAPTMWAWRRTAREASLGRLPFCIVNQAKRHLSVCIYRLDDTLRWIPVVGLAGQSSGDLEPLRILELDPPDDMEEFQVEVIFGEAVAPPHETWAASAVGAVGSAARGAGYIAGAAASLVPRVPYISAEPAEILQPLRAIVRRGGVYCISEPSLPSPLCRGPRPSVPHSMATELQASEGPTSELGPAEVLALLRVPRSVLPAYGEA